MSFPNQEGPVNRLQPAQIYTTCTGCKYHKRILWKSGDDPQYKDTCEHETAPKLGLMLSTGNLDNYNGYPQPGDWCPFEVVNKIDLA
ncbi:MAG: hypothetical protein P4L31_07620 [Candidatus Babeliales bacterium]|nr:hypothetical protein [Candidatus Babeliales bacterium]